MAGRQLTIQQQVGKGLWWHLTVAAVVVVSTHMCYCVDAYETEELVEGIGKLLIKVQSFSLDSKLDVKKVEETLKESMQKAVDEVDAAEAAMEDDGKQKELKQEVHPIVKIVENEEGTMWSKRTKLIGENKRGGAIIECGTTPKAETQNCGEVLVLLYCHRNSLRTVKQIATKIVEVMRSYAGFTHEMIGEYWDERQKVGVSVGMYYTASPISLGSINLMEEQEITITDVVEKIPVTRVVQMLSGIKKKEGEECRESWKKKLFTAFGGEKKQPQLAIGMQRLLSSIEEDEPCETPYARWLSLSGGYGATYIEPTQVTVEGPLKQAVVHVVRILCHAIPRDKHMIKARLGPVEITIS